MDQNKPNTALTSLKSYLIERKNRKIFFLATGAVILFIVFLGLTIVLVLSSQSRVKKKGVISSRITISPRPSIQPQDPETEEIIEAGYSLDCQLAVTTDKRKLYVTKLPRCTDKLNYRISPSKKYLGYILTENKKASQLNVYSLENNIQALFLLISSPLIDYRFDKKDNLAVLLDKNNQNDSQTLIYYFNTLLFDEYPDNYYKELMTFTNMDKRKVEMALPEIKDTFTKIVEKKDTFELSDSKGIVQYIIAFPDLETRLTPSAAPVINKEALKWEKRIFYFNDRQFKTVDIDGTNELIHPLQCDGNDIVPIGFGDDLFSRSPDGKTLAFLMPTEDQMRDIPSWKQDLLEQKKIFSRGEIVLYDLVKDSCQKTALAQSINYRENFSFSPNGLFLAFVNKGIGIYSLQNHQDYQLAVHNPDNSSDSTAVTGPLVWDGESKFIYAAVSKIEDRNPISTQLVRVYFNVQKEGSEQEIIKLPSHENLYAVSPDGNKVLYNQEQTIYKYNIETEKNSLFKSDSGIRKLIWLRNNTIVSNLWIGSENLYFQTIGSFPISAFQVDFNGELMVFTPLVAGSKPQMKVYDLLINREKPFKDKKQIEGQLLRLYY